MPSASGLLFQSDRRPLALPASNDETARVEASAFVLNKRARTVRLDGAEVMLTRLEFDLLVALVDNRGQVLEYEPLLSLGVAIPRDR